LWLMAPYYAGTPDASLISSLPLHTTGLGANPANGYVFTWLDRFDVRRDPNAHQGFGGGGRHFCLGAGLARLELKLWIEENLRRFPEIELAGDCERVSSTFLNQYLHIPVKVG
jgi:hypothetical protein